MTEPATGGTSPKKDAAPPSGPTTGRTGWDFLTEILPYLRPMFPLLIVFAVLGGAVWLISGIYQRRVTEAEDRVAEARSSADEAHKRVIDAFTSIEAISKDGVGNLKSTLDLKAELELKLKQSDEILRQREREEAARQYKQIEEKLAAAGVDLKKARDDLAEAEKRGAASATTDALREELRLVARLAAGAADLSPEDRATAQAVVARETSSPTARIDVGGVLERFAASTPRSPEILEALQKADVSSEEIRKAVIASKGFEAWYGSNDEFVGVLGHDERALLGVVRLAVDRGRIEFVACFESMSAVRFPAEFDGSASTWLFERYSSGAPGAPPSGGLYVATDHVGPTWTAASLHNATFGSKLEKLVGDVPALAVLSAEEWLDRMGPGAAKAWVEGIGEGDATDVVRRAIRRRTLSPDDLTKGGNLGVVDDTALAKRLLDLCMAAGKGDAAKARSFCTPEISDHDLDLVQKAVLTDDFRVRSAGAVAGNPTVQAQGPPPAPIVQVVTEHGHQTWKRRPGVTLVWEFVERPSGRGSPKEWLLSRVSVRDFASAAGGR